MYSYHYPEADFTDILNGIEALSEYGGFEKNGKSNYERKQYLESVINALEELKKLSSQTPEISENLCMHIDNAISTFTRLKNTLD